VRQVEILDIGVQALRVGYSSSGRYRYSTRSSSELVGPNSKCLVLC
jgi:hypothetical protein